jgi:hypothetical protein
MYFKFTLIFGYNYLIRAGKETIMLTDKEIAMHLTAALIEKGVPATHVKNTTSQEISDERANNVARIYKIIYESLKNLD